LKKTFLKYGGIIIGGLYGLLMRIILGKDFQIDFAGLFSITFIWLLPIILGLTPLIFSPKEDLIKFDVRIFRPVLSVLFFFILCLWTGHEDIVCIVIISIPFLIVAGLAGIIFGGIILRYRDRKGILFSIFLIPFISGIIEPAFPSSTQQFETTSTIIINSGKSEIWNNIVRVDTIQEREYKRGLFNFAGIPRPLYAELDRDTIGAVRIGHFEGGLQFQENIIEWDRNDSVAFDIKIIPSTTKKTVFERHVLNSQNFKFLNAKYRLKAISGNRTELSLTTKYELTTKINYYGEFWGTLLLKDFQDRLISVVKNRCEK
jgi:hypothetical protein